MRPSSLHLFLLLTHARPFHHSRLLAFFSSSSSALHPASSLGLAPSVCLLSPLTLYISLPPTEPDRGPWPGPGLWKRALYRAVSQPGCQEPFSPLLPQDSAIATLFCLWGRQTSKLWGVEMWVGPPVYPMTQSLVLAKWPHPCEPSCSWHTVGHQNTLIK